MRAAREKDSLPKGREEGREERERRRFVEMGARDIATGCEWCWWTEIDRLSASIFNSSEVQQQSS